MRKTITLLIALLTLTVSSWATQITWNQAAVQSVGISQYQGNGEPMSMTINGITVTATAPGSEDYSGFYYRDYEEPYYSYISLDNGGTITFATSLGELTSIVIHLDEAGSAYGFGEGWSENTTSHTLSWTGNAASAVLGNDEGYANISYITSIDFTVVSVPTSTSWNLSDLASISISQYHGQGEPMSQTINGITATATALGSDDNSDFYYDSNANSGNIYLENGGTFTFSSPFGNLASIVIHTTNEYGIYTNGWSWDETEHTLSWTGDAASVVLTDAYVSNIISIDFTFVTEEPDPDVPTHLVSTITWNTDDLATVTVPTNDFQTIKTIRVTNSCPDPYNDYCYFLYQDDPYNYCGFSMYNGGSLIFTPESGRLTSIVINWNYEGPDPDLVPGSGWSFTNSQLTWTSDDEDGAESVVLKSNSSKNLTSGPIYSIVFTLAADPDAQADVKWDKSELVESNLSLLAYDGIVSEQNQTIEGIVATVTAPEDGDYSQLLYDNPNDKVAMSIWGNGILTFAPETGRLTRIVIAGIVDLDNTNLPVESGWTATANKLIWTGDASYSVDLANASVDYITYVAFTIDDSDPNDTREVPELKFLNGSDELTEATIVKDKYGELFKPGTYYYPNTEYFLYVNNGVKYYQGQPFIDWAKPTEKGLTMTYSVPNNDVITLTKTSGNSFEFTVNGLGDAVVTAHTDGNEDYKPASITFTIHVVFGKAATKECVLAFVGGPNDGQLVPEDYKFELETGQEMPWMELREKSDPTVGYAPSFSIWGSRKHYVASIQAETKLRALTAGDDVFRVRYARYQDGDMNGEYKEIEIPVHIKPTEIALTSSVNFASDPSSNSSIANNATYDATTQQIQIGQVISDEMVQAALDCYAFGHPGWDENLQNTISFELPQGTGSFKINGSIQAGCLLKVKIRTEAGVRSFTPTQVANGEAVVEYDVPNQTAVVIYINSTGGGSPAPKRAPAAKKDAPLAALSGIDMSPVYAITSKPDPDNSSVYYSTHFNETQKYRLPAGTEAYVATISGENMNLTKVVDGGQVLPANTAVILKSTSASVVLTPTDAAAVTVSAENALHGTDSEMAAPGNCYVLSGHSTDYSVTGVGFYEFTGTIPAHKAYLTISGGAAYAPKKLRFVFNNEQLATGMENAAEALKSEKRIENGQLIIIKNGVRYNAQGQVVK